MIENRGGGNRWPVREPLAGADESESCQSWLRRDGAPVIGAGANLTVDSLCSMCTHIAGGEGIGVADLVERVDRRRSCGAARARALERARACQSIVIAVQNP
jgi:hypothetical protein